MDDRNEEQMSEHSGYLAPEEMTPDDWQVYDRTGLPPRRGDRPMGDELEHAGWRADSAARREREERYAKHIAELEAMSTNDRLKDIRGETT